MALIYSTNSFANIVKSYVYLTKDLGIKEEIGKAIKKLPRILSYSIEENIEPKLKFYESRGYSRDYITKKCWLFNCLGKKN